MGRQVIQIGPFSKGLNTEINKLTDAPDYTTDELNAVIRKDGSRMRRLGADYEEHYTLSNHTNTENDEELAYSSCEWNDIEGDKNNNYIVIQAGGTILFYKNKGQPFSQEESVFTLDLKGYAIDDTDAYKKTPVSFNVAYGCLFVSSTAITPFRLQTIAERVEEEVPDDVYPYAKISCKVPVSKQGRGAGHGYVQFYINDVKVGPRWNLADYYGTTGNCVGGPWMPFSEVYAQYWNGLPQDARRGITAEPSITGQVPSRWSEPDDLITFRAPEQSGLTLQGLRIKIEMGFLHQTRRSSDFVVIEYEGSLIGGRQYQHQRGLTLQVRDIKGVEDFLAPEVSPEKISYKKLYNLLNQGWTPKLIGDFYKAKVGGYACFPSNTLAQQYLKDSATTPFKPTALLDSTFGNTPAPKGHFVLDYFKQQRAGKSNLSRAMEDVAHYCEKTVEEILDESFSGTADEQVPDTTPRYTFVADTCAYAGRMFYLAGDVLLYSQILAEDIDKADKCYQEADPTSEELSDIISTDGGTLNLPDIGNGQKLLAVGAYLVVVGDRGLHAIGGTANNIFTATAYSASALPTYTTSAPQSFVSTEYGTLYWGDTGIILISAAEGLSLQNISENTVQKFYNKISTKCRKRCIAVYDKVNKEVWWFYPDVEDSSTLDRVLKLDLETMSFTPLKLSTVEDETGFKCPKVKVPVPLKVAFKSFKQYPFYVVDEPLADDKVYRCRWRDSLGSPVTLPDVAYVYTDAGPVTVANGNYQVFEDFDLFERTELGELDGNRYYLSCVWVHKEGLPANTVYGRRILDFDNKYALQPTKFVYSDKPEAFDEDFSNAVYNDIQLTDLYEGQIVPATAPASTRLSSLRTQNINDIQYVTSGTIVYTASEDDTNIARKLRVVDEDLSAVLAADPVEGLESSFSSFVMFCLDSQANKYTFGDFVNLNCKDWDKADYTGDGVNYLSYLVGHPINLGDINRKKTMPYLLTTFKRTEQGTTTDGNKLYESGCNAAVKWSWSTAQDSGDWDLSQRVYRPDREYLHREFVDTKTRVRGSGKSFMIQLESVTNHQFIIEALGLDLFGDSRI